MIVCAYLRVSTEGQNENGWGLEAQRAAIESEALRRGWDDVTWIQERASGKDLKNRPKLDAVLTLLGLGDVLVVAKLDRLSRSVRDFADLVELSRERRWSLVLLDLQLDTSTPMGEAMANMAVVFAQLERRMIGQRTREGLAVARANGVQLGMPPRARPEVIRRILRERTEGRTYGEIARGLNQDGVEPPMQGQAYYPTTVRRIFLRWKDVAQ